MVKLWRWTAIRGSSGLSAEDTFEEAAAATPEINETAVLITVALATMLAPLNSTMIGIALPEVLGEFATDLSSGSWLVISYLITMAALQPVGGKLGDRYGRKPLIVGGLLYFGLASLGAAFASSLTELLIFRVQQAIAGAIALPNGMALLREIVPAERRASRIGLLGSGIVLAAAVGPPLGGVLIKLAGWRAVFSANLLIILPALVLAIKALPHLRASHQRRPFDLNGALLLLVILSSAAFLLTTSERQFLPAVATWGATGLLILLVFWFLRLEGAHDDPVFQPRFFRNVTFAAANAGMALSNLSMYTIFLVIPFFLAELPGWSSTQVGLVLSALWAPTVVCAPIGGRLADRWGRRWPTTLGLLLLTAGTAVLFWVQEGEVSLWVMLSGLSVAGIGLGLSQAGLQTAVLESVKQQHAGSASGMFSTSRYIGSIAGSSALPLLYGTQSDLQGFMRVLSLVVIAALASTIASLWIRDRPAPD